MKRILFMALASLILAGPALAGHQGEVGDIQKCTTCHTSNLVSEHGGFAGEACSRCHNPDGSLIDPAIIPDLALIDPTIEKGKLGEAVLCSDCHTGSSHIDKHGSYMSDWMDMSGVQPASAPLWTQPTDFTGRNPATEQFQVCFKCHSFNSFGEVPDGVTGLIGPSGNNLTDQAMEFNPANKSAHPVQVTLNEQTGSYSPKSITVSQMKSPWTNVGNQQMQCSDCHGGDAGSGNFMLGGTTYNEWPRSSLNNDELWALSDIKKGLYQWSSRLLCAKCHPIYSGDWENRAHEKHDERGFKDEPWESAYKDRSVCVACHTAVPHGSMRSRLIGYIDDPAPYTIEDYKHSNLKLPIIRGFKKSTTGPFGEGSNGYDKDSCFIPRGGGCGSHDDDVLSYDP